MNPQLNKECLVWAAGSLCALNRVPFSEALLLQQFPPPYHLESLLAALRLFGLTVATVDTRSILADRGSAPMLAGASIQYLGFLKSKSDTDAEGENPAADRLILIGKVEAERVVYFESGNPQPHIAAWSTLSAAIEARLIGITRHQPEAITPSDNDTVSPDDERARGTSERGMRAFGFRWFVPELLKHRALWRDVLIASLAIQLMALATPLFTQVVIDKVVVHRTESTLIAIGVGLFLFMSFSAALTWIRQYLVLHTGNRVDAVLGSAVFAHLLHLPPRYFEHRPTGVIAARLHGVETIREFIASAAVTLVLDLPFLLIFLGIMFSYSVTLTLITLAVIALIAGLSLAVAPIFQRRLNQQFLLGARNQAFLTEYVAGMETVKSLQMEPQLNQTYRDYLASYLQAGFATKQIGNSYNVFANTLEQMMTLAILIVGAYTVMREPGFSIGMLVAFQMFSGRVSQPILRIVGIWQQFQQANIAVKRLGDILDVPTEPYTLIPARMNKPHTGGSLIEIEGLGFRYGEHLPFLYQDLNFTIQPGQAIAIMGPSGCGKSTLGKLLQAFHLPTQGRIKLDGVDIRYLSANELRSHFGIVPQETTLFSGTIYQNLAYANPNASFEEIVNAARLAEIHDAIEALPEGYQTEIGERGAGLSGGQKQRIAIARALLKKPRVMIFDEATASLDPHTAEQIAKTVNKLKSQVTMLFVSHGLPEALQVDAVLQFGSGSGPEMIPVWKVNVH
jgi:ATP-binding cassette, subfamily B, bacterial HlyB/CyaB